MFYADLLLGGSLDGKKNSKHILDNNDMRFRFSKG